MFEIEFSNTPNYYNPWTYFFLCRRSSSNELYCRVFYIQNVVCFIYRTESTNFHHLSLLYLLVTSTRMIVSDLICHKRVFTLLTVSSVRPDWLYRLYVLRTKLRAYVIFLLCIIDYRLKTEKIDLSDVNSGRLFVMEFNGVKLLIDDSSSEHIS